MNWLDFLASIFGSLVKLAWPATVFGSIWLFRKPIEKLLPYARFKYKEWEISLAKAEETAAALPPPPAPLPDSPENHTILEDVEKFERFAEYSPRGAIAAERIEVESAVRGLFETLPNTGPSALRRPSMSEMTRLLGIAKKLDKGTIRLLDQIRSIGNQAVHGEGTVTTEDALRYRDLASQAIMRVAAERWHEVPEENG